MGYRGQTMKDAKGTIRVEQGPGGWHVKIGSKGYCSGIFDTKEAEKCDHL